LPLCRALPEADVLSILRSRFHEDRLLALLVLVARTKTATPKERRRLAAVYLAHSHHVNNWDLVDASAEHLVGRAFAGLARRRVLVRLAKSALLWDRRIAMVATFAPIKDGDPQDALHIAALLLGDEEDLMHKATGWMLREVGKRCGRADLLGFLREHAARMPRTALRYAIEHLDPAARAAWLAQPRAAPRVT
jgi:3-methyladenine DNA glycosylase AlkD